MIDMDYLDIRIHQAIKGVKYGGDYGKVKYKLNKFLLDNPPILWYNGHIKDRRVCFMRKYKEGDTSKCS